MESEDIAQEHPLDQSEVPLSFAPPESLVDGVQGPNEEFLEKSAENGVKEPLSDSRTVEGQDMSDNLNSNSVISQSVGEEECVKTMNTVGDAEPEKNESLKVPTSYSDSLDGMSNENVVATDITGSDSSSAVGSNNDSDYSLSSCKNTVNKDSNVLDVVKANSPGSSNSLCSSSNMDLTEKDNNHVSDHGSSHSSLSNTNTCPQGVSESTESLQPQNDSSNTVEKLDESRISQSAEVVETSLPDVGISSSVHVGSESDSKEEFDESLLPQKDTSDAVDNLSGSCNAQSAEVETSLPDNNDNVSSADVCLESDLKKDGNDSSLPQYDNSEAVQNVDQSCNARPAEVDSSLPDGDNGSPESEREVEKSADCLVSQHGEDDSEQCNEHVPSDIHVHSPAAHNTSDATTEQSLPAEQPIVSELPNDSNKDNCSSDSGFCTQVLTSTLENQADDKLDDNDGAKIPQVASLNAPEDSSEPSTQKDLENNSAHIPSCPQVTKDQPSPSQMASTSSNSQELQSVSMEKSSSSSYKTNNSKVAECKTEPIDEDDDDDFEECSDDDEKRIGSELPSTSKVSTSDVQTPCRIQYVFINKPQKKKVKKKKFGVLYNQAFRHFQKAKMKFPSMFGKPKKEKVTEGKTAKLEKKKHKEEDKWKETFLVRGPATSKGSEDKQKSKKKTEESKKKGKNKKPAPKPVKVKKTKAKESTSVSKRESRSKAKSKSESGKTNKSRSESSTRKKNKSERKSKTSRNSRKCKNDTFINYEEDFDDEFDDQYDDDNETTVWKNSKRARRSAQNEPDVKSIRRRLLSPEEEEEVRVALTQPGATIESVSSQFGIAKTIVRKFCPAEVKDEEPVPKVKKLKLKRVKAKKRKEERTVVVKEELPDDPVAWEYQNSQQVPLDENKESMDFNDEDNNDDEGLNNDLDDDHNVSQDNDHDVKNIDTFITNSFANSFRRARPRIGGRHRKELTLNEKIKAIHELQKKGSKITHVAKKFGISSSAVSRLNKVKHSILLKAESGDLCGHLKRTRDCKAPELDRALLRWYRSIEGVSKEPVSLSNVLLREKSHDIAKAMGCTYMPTLNWILRWKYRHNIVCKKGRIECRDELDSFDKKVDMAAVLSSVEAELLYHSQMLENGIKEERQDEFVVCEHCGVPVYTARRSKKRTVHLKECPLHSRRKDLTLGEKVKVLKALEKPGIKMSHVARKFGISSSAISRIHKDKIDILSCYNEGYINMDRKRSRVSKEPEVERALCDWYRSQYDLGIHVSSYSVREKAKEIAAAMGKEFTPSESWVFRWRHRNYVHGPLDNEEVEEEEEEEEEEEVEPKVEPEDQKPNIDHGDDGLILDEETGERRKKRKRKRKTQSDGTEVEPKKKKLIFPKSVMCEKCGCVSVRLANNRIRSMRHSRGCPLLKPRNEMNYEFRIKMLQELDEPGATLSSVGRKYGVSTSSMSRMKQNKNTIIGSDPDQRHKKRIRECKEPEVAKQLYAWYMEKLSEGIHVSGTKLKAKASEMAREEGRDFKVSTGWLGRWKNRYNILFKQQDGYHREKIPRKEGGTRRRSKKSANVIVPVAFEKREPQTFESPGSSDYGHHSVTDMTNVNMAEVAQAIPAPRMFFTRTYPQNPWDLANQASTSCARPKEFIATVAAHSIPTEDNQAHYAYDPLTNTARQMFHHTLETFALTNGYPVSMGVGTDTLSSRDFLQPEENEIHQQQGIVISSASSANPVAAAAAAAIASSSAPIIHPSSHTNLIHQQQQQPPTAHTNNIPQAPLAPTLLNHHHHTHHRNQSHLPQQQQQQQQQQQLAQAAAVAAAAQPVVLNLNLQQQQQLQQQQASQPSHHSSPSPMLIPNEEQDPAVMEAFKIMSSFAQKNSLGADVQNALRTMQMAMKTQAGASGVNRKDIKPNTYTNI